MASRTLTVGAVQVTRVCDVSGDFPAPLERAFPLVAPAAWAPWRRRHPEAFGGTDRWRLRDWCFVVRARDRVVLVDTGVGEAGTPGADWIGIPGRLPEELAAAGVDPAEVDLVVLTHLHLDHVGWNLAWDGERPRPRFPRARYLVQRADWERFAREGDDDDRGGVRALRGPAPGARGGRAAGRRPGPGRRAEPAPHPRLPEPAGPLRRRRGAALGRRRQPPGPGRPARVGPASDVQPEVAAATRRRLLDEVEAGRKWLAPAHLPEPFGTVERADGGRHWSGRP
jgi:Metallo-beta-lactamase superfamily